MKKLLLIVLIAFCVNGSIALGANDESAKLMRERRSIESYMFTRSMLLHPEGWRLFKTRTAVERLAYNAGHSDEFVQALMGYELPMKARGASLQEDIDRIREKALEAGLIENLNDLVMVEELEEIDPINQGNKKAFGVR